MNSRVPCLAISNVWNSLGSPLPVALSACITITVPIAFPLCPGAVAWEAFLCQGVPASHIGPKTSTMTEIFLFFPVYPDRCLDST